MDLIVFSHLRWDFVYQRPQHLLSRFARASRVFFWEEPEFRNGAEPRLNVSAREDLLTVIVPELPTGTSEEESWALQQELLSEFLADHRLERYASWYYTPMARHFSRHLRPAVTIYDCMDELSAFRGAPAGLTSAEQELLSAADLVFTGGQSLFESKRSRHHSVHLFPSSIDVAHFSKATDQRIADPPDQAAIPHPRLGYCGVIDERMDLELLAGVAARRPDWQLVMVGPVVKINEADLPKASNIHYLGPKKYADLPEYLSGWDIGILPFARNESTRFISPTKTPEYLAAGLPVVSSPITDVVRPYGKSGLVSIADDTEEFVSAAERLLARDRSQEQERLRKVMEFLARSSWDRTFSEMQQLLEELAMPTESVRQIHATQRSAGTVAAAD